jgi:hypothetical protein
MTTIFSPSSIPGSVNHQRTTRKIYLADLSPQLKNSKFFDISTYVTKLSVNYDIALASEISFEVLDPGLEMSKNNYFIIGRDVIYETQTLGQINSYSGEVKLVKQIFEISSVNVSQGPGGSAIYSIQCYSKAIQQMKRDKKPQNIKGNGTAYIRAAATKYGLQFYGQETSKKKTINKAQGSKESESLWDVMQRLAEEAKFVLFEVDGILVFASEKFLMHKWGTNIRYVTKTTTDPKTKKKRKKKVARRFIPLQFPNEGESYVGKPGYFSLTEYPVISRRDNDPYAADGSCSVERLNGTQIRPGMTAYVGNIPNMSGYYIIDGVSFNEMTNDSVSVSFRTEARDEEKDKIKQIPIGTIVAQTFIEGVTQIRTTVESAKDARARPISSARPDKRILPPNQPTNELPFAYPQMRFADISKTYSAFIDFTTPSTRDENSLIITGNLNLWQRPVLAFRNRKNTKNINVETMMPIIKVEPFGTEYRAILIPTIYTSAGGQPIIKTEEEVLAKYNTDGGYQGSAKHLGVLRGSTKVKARLNARDYAFLLKRQQLLVLQNRFPDISVDDIPNTPGGLDSNWE